MCRKLLLLFLIAVFSSCDPFHLAKGHVTRTTKRAGLELKHLETDRYSMNYWDSGTDQPVIFMIHGLGADSEFHWYKQLNALSEYRVIVPNLLYFGGSRPSIENYSVNEQVNAMLTLVRELKLNEFYLCGFSYGGLVAAEMARKEPQKVKKLILLDAPVKYFVREDMQPLLREFGMNKPSDLLVPADGKAMKDLSSVIYKRPLPIPMSFHRSFQKNVYKKNANQYKAILKKMEEDRKHFEQENYPFRFPVLLIWGENDILVPLSVAQQLQEHIGDNAKLEVIKGTAHVPNLEKAKQFNSLLKDFLKEPIATDRDITSGN